MRRLPRELLLGILSAAFFLGLSAGTTLRWPVAALLAAAVYGAGRLLIPRKLEDSETEVAPGVTKAELDRALRDDEAASSRFDTLAGVEMDDKLSGRIRSLGVVAQEVLIFVQGHPAAILPLRPFHDKALPDTIRMIEKLLRLRAAGNLSDEGNKLVDDVQDRLIRVEKGFATLLESIQGSDDAGLRNAAAALADLVESDLGSAEPAAPSAASASPAAKERP